MVGAIVLSPTDVARQEPVVGSIYTVGCTLNSRLLSGHLGFVAGALRGSLFPVCYGLVGVQLT